MEGTSKQARTYGVSLSLLPDFGLRNDGRIVNVGPTAQRLVAFLALHGGRMLRRAYVSGSLWVDAPQHRANASLRSAVWRAPVCHGQAVVGASSTHVWLDSDIGVDLDRSRDLARRLLEAHDLDEARIDPQRDVGAFTEDLLVGWYDEWTIIERERFRQLRLQALEQLGELLLRDGRPREAVQVGLTVVMAEPLRESAQRLLIRAHLSEGNVAEALRQYRSFADLLARELGVRPSAAMEAAVRSVLGRAAPRTGSDHAW